MGIDYGGDVEELVEVGGYGDLGGGGGGGCGGEEDELGRGTVGEVLADEEECEGNEDEEEDDLEGGSGVIGNGGGVGFHAGSIRESKRIVSMRLNLMQCACDAANNCATGTEELKHSTDAEVKRQCSFLFFVTKLLLNKK